MPIHRMPIKIADKEVAKLGRELADKRLEHSKLKEDKAEDLREFNAKLKALDAEIETLAHSVQEKVRFEDVEVTLVPDDKRLMMEIFRKSNDERIDVRQMTDDEKEAARKRCANPELPFMDAGDGKKASKGATKGKGGKKGGRGKAKAEARA